MSLELMTALWRSDAPPPLRMTLLALADAANDEGLCEPRAEELARKCDVDEDVIRGHMQVLAEHGLLTSVTEHAPGPVPCYRLTIPTRTGLER